MENIMPYLQNELNKIRFSQLLRIASFIDHKIIQSCATDTEFQYWDDDIYAECYFDFCRGECCRQKKSRELYVVSRAKFRKAKAKWLTLCYNYPIFRRFTLAQILSLSELYKTITGYSSYYQYKYRFVSKMVFTTESINEIKRMMDFNDEKFNDEGYLIKGMREVSTFVAPHEYINDSIAAQIYMAALKDKPTRVQTLAEARQKYAEYRETYHPNQRIFFATS